MRQVMRSITGFVIVLGAAYALAAPGSQADPTTQAPAASPAQPSPAAQVAEAPAPPAPAVRFASGSSARDIPIGTWSNLIFVRCGVNGSAPVWFVLDTGATFTTIGKRHATELGLDLSDRVKSPRTGLEYSRLAGVTFSLPGVEIGGQKANVLELGELGPFAGHDIAGILGYDVLAALVVEVDYAAGKMSLFDPQSYAYSGDGAKLPLSFAANLPLVEARLEQPDKPAVSGKLIVDAGSMAALSLLSGELAGRTAEIPLSVGIAGVGSGVRVGRVAALRLGTVELRDVISVFPSADPDAREDPMAKAIGQFALGLIGGDILHRYTVIWDYSRSVMILEPGRGASAPFEADMSGLFVVAAGEGLHELRIMAVQPGLPGAAAGLQAGDVITAVDGRDAGGIGLGELRELLRRDGTTITLTVRRGERSFDAVLRLERLV